MDQSQTCADSDMLRMLEAVVANMPRKSREIFLANRLDNMTYREIADVTGLTVPQVERHMAKALSRIMKHLDADASHGRADLLRRLRQLLTKFFGGEIASQPSKRGQGV